MFFVCFSVLQLFNGKLSFLHRALNKDHSNKNDIQLSPEGEVNSGGYIPRSCSPTMRGKVVFVFTK